MAARTITLFFLFIIITIIVPIHSRLFDPEPDDPERDCADRWIHIRNLPHQFNLDLITNCSQYPLFDNFCPYVLNHGLGQKTHNRSHSWYRTDPLMLEIIFHRRMLEYPCLTDNPTSASAIYLPYYAGIDSLRYLYGPDVNSSFEHGLHLYKFLTQIDSPEIWNRRKGHDHFLVMARQAWDFTQPLTNDPPIWGTSFLELPEFFNLTALTLESRAWPWQEQAVPYPTSFHPPNVALLESWLNRVRRSRRTTLMLFVGGGGISSSPNIRRSIRLECDSCQNLTANSFGYSKLCEFVDCSNGVCEHDPIRFMKPMLQSSFCLQPPGDTPTRRSTFDGILSGCIPVFFEEQSAKGQYNWHLPVEKYGEFSVFISKEDVVFKGKTILEILSAIPRDEVRRMREKIVELIPNVMYRKHGSSFGLRSKNSDAFDIAIDGTLQRIKSRLQDVSLE
ncbi:probable xyloglucan galactosyltransferase GT19 [Impatiens glandulifera]|uniref:probable xyloglucan galactosyltransferase GT19 n=1 Tax=Impatiens glandulifera TaxID=253017 RepID=UPI001FB0F374|nr:probable xyloglucan galactosyltransferase GT19 [Impatiens glandulifera]